MSGLAQTLAPIASTPVLLVASDFDGTLAPIVDRPAAATIDPRAWSALAALADLPHTHAAVVSGRARDDLLTRVPQLVGAPISAVGSHGIELPNTSVRLDPAAAERLRRAHELVQSRASVLAGAIVERKPASVTLHFRLADPTLAAAAIAELTPRARDLGLHILLGDHVLELFVLAPGKGAAVADLRRHCGATGAVFIGDDVTDESVFAEFRARGGGKIGIKVGPSDSAADVRIGSQADVAGVLETLLSLRTAWLAGRRVVPIERHSMLSDQRTAALVDPEGSIVWACFPRLDSPPLFASLLDTPARGEFSIRPVAADPKPPTQRYDDDSFILHTDWPGLSVSDYFDCSGGRPFQRAGRSELIRVIRGSGRARITFAPRLDFGRVQTHLLAKPDGLEVTGWHDPIVLRCSHPIVWTIIEDGPHHTAQAEIDAAADPIVLELRYGTASFRPAPIDEAARREQSTRLWSGWAHALKLPQSTPPAHASLLRRSALVLKALCQGPTGAIAAAATTSLPEHLGGIRNWDYRYCWIRDACMSASALVRIGNTGVGLKLLDWLVQVVAQCESPERLRPLYTLAGETLGAEAEISGLSGYGQSRPVRIGNAASHQVQLDVFGPVVELVALLADAGAPVTPELWRLVEAMVRAVQLRWEEPDHGIWEIRGPKAHHIHTKAMCWLAVDRGLLVADRAMGLERPGWERLRERIAADISDRGCHPHTGSFTAAYDDETPDAASLFVGLTGLLRPDDPRFIATVHAVERDLRDGPAVHRYRRDDGLPGREGAWLICACWLAESLWLIGRSTDARALLDQVAALAGPTGLMAEQFDAEHDIALGNFPQAYSHLGFINAAVRLQS